MGKSIWVPGGDEDQIPGFWTHEGRFSAARVPEALRGRGPPFLVPVRGRSRPGGKPRKEADATPAEWEKNSQWMGEFIEAGPHRESKRFSAFAHNESSP